MSFFKQLAGAFTSTLEAAVNIFASQSPLVDSIVTTGASAVGAIVGATPATVDQVVANINEARRIISPVASSILAFKAASAGSGNDEQKVRAGASLGIANNAYVLAAGEISQNISQVRAAAPTTARERRPDAGSRSTLTFADAVGKKVDDMLYALEQIRPTSAIAPSGYVSNANLEAWVRPGEVSSDGTNVSYSGSMGSAPVALAPSGQLNAFPRPQYLKPNQYVTSIQLKPSAYLAGAPANAAGAAWTATNVQLRFRLTNGTIVDVPVITGVTTFDQYVNIPANADALLGFICTGAQLFGLVFNIFGTPLSPIVPISAVSYIDYNGVERFLRDGTTWFDVFGALAGAQTYSDPNFSVVKVFEQRFTDDADIVNVLQAVDRYLQQQLGTTLSATAQINCGGNPISFTDAVPLSWLYSQSLVFDSLPNSVALWQQIKNALEVARDGCALSDQLSLYLQANLRGEL